MHKLFLLLIVVTLFVNACAVGPNYEVVNMPEANIDLANHISTVERERDWWKAFEDKRLDQLIDLTLENNPSLDVAEANVKAAYAVLRNVNNDTWLKGDLGVNYSAQNQVIPGFSEERELVRSYSAGANLRWDFDLFGKFDRATESAEANAEATYYDWQGLKVSLVAQVADTYAQLNGMGRRIDVANKNIISLKKTRDIIQLRIEAGIASELERHRINAELYGVEAVVPVLQARYEKAKQVLVALVGGTAVSGYFDLGNIVSDLPDLDVPFAIGDPKQLLRRRSDLRSAERLLASATAQIGYHRADLYPDISASGFLGFFADDDSSLSSDTRAWSIAPRLSWSLLDMGSVRARINVASANQEAAFANFHKVLIAVVSEAQSALSAYAQTQRERQLLQMQITESTAALKLARLQYDVGEVDLLDILDTERRLLSAKDNLVEAQTRTFQGIVEVYRAFGGGLLLEQNNEIELAKNL